MNIAALFSDSFKDSNGLYTNAFTTKELQLIHEHRLFKCFLPEHLGGLAMNLSETLDIIEQCAYLNGSLGWLIQIGNGGNYFVTNLEKSVADQLFTPADAVIAGSGTPTGTARRVSGGYMFTGQWRFCSGADYATLFTATCKIEGSEEVISGIVPRSDVTIIPDWDTSGMQQTSTHSISLNEQFVPNGHIFKTLERRSYFDLPILDLPFVIYAQAFFIHVIYGLIRRILDETERMFESKKHFWHAHKPVKFTKVRLAIENGRNRLSTCRNEVNVLIAELEKSQLENIAFHEDVKVSIIKQSLELKQYAHDTFSLLGMDALYRNHPLNTAYMDLITICQHSLLNS